LFQEVHLWIVGSRGIEVMIYAQGAVVEFGPNVAFTKGFKSAAAEFQVSLAVIPYNTAPGLTKVLKDGIDLVRISLNADAGKMDLTAGGIIADHAQPPGHKLGACGENLRIRKMMCQKRRGARSFQVVIRDNCGLCSGGHGDSFLMQT